MAVYAALTSLLQTLNQIPQPHQQITDLHCRCDHLRSLLKIVDDSPLKSSSTVKNLKGLIRDASYEAEDVLEHVGMEFRGLEEIIGDLNSLSDDLSDKIKDGRVEDLPPKNSRIVGSSSPRHVGLEFRALEEMIDEPNSILDDLSDKIKDGRVEDLPPKNALPVGSSSLRHVGLEFRDLEEKMDQLNSIWFDLSRKIKLRILEEIIDQLKSIWYDLSRKIKLRVSEGIIDQLNSNWYGRAEDLQLNAFWYRKAEDLLLNSLCGDQPGTIRDWIWDDLPDKIKDWGVEDLPPKNALNVGSSSPRHVGVRFKVLSEITDELHSIWYDLSDKSKDGRVEELRPKFRALREIIDDLNSVQWGVVFRHLEEITDQLNSISGYLLASPRHVDHEFQAFEQIISQLTLRWNFLSRKITEGRTESLQLNPLWCDLPDTIKDWGIKDLPPKNALTVGSSSPRHVGLDFWALKEIIDGLRSIWYDLSDKIKDERVEELPPKFWALKEVIDELNSISDDLSDKIKDGRVEDLPPKNALTVGSSSPRHVGLEFRALEERIFELNLIWYLLSRKNKDVRVKDLQLNSLGGDLPDTIKDRGVTGAPSELHLNSSTEALLKLKDRLTGAPSELYIISIVGMGGIGKTTLARNLYEDLLSQQHFDTRAWIVVSQQYHLREMFTGLLDSTRHDGVGELNKKNIEELAVHLHQSLKGRRYLIVMDDVWDTKVWDDVRRFFPDDNNGSRIILTTRLSEVAIYPSSYGTIHHMNLLSPKESWNLLRENLFGKESCPLELEGIGEKIAANCKGLPLAITVISGLLHKGSKTQDYWQCIAETVKSAVTDNNNEFIEILSLSYDSLPHHLKPCFLYMGGFPEDYEIPASKLIKLWIAEGFVRPKVHKSLEEVAEDYLKDLNDRSLVMVQKKNVYCGEKPYIVIHDMLRELCLKKAQDENFLQILNSDICHFPQGQNSQHLVSIHSDVLWDNMPFVHHSLVRSILCFHDFRDINNSRKLLSITMSCRRLRVLDATQIRFYEFPMQILELVRLRYLAFFFSWGRKMMPMLPAAISKLQNLQTLVVPSHGIYLPESIWEMRQMRHLHFGQSVWPRPLILKDSVVLENLQTLAGVTNFRCTREVTEMVPNLKDLEVSYFCGILTNRWSEYEFNNFVKLHQLERMTCQLLGWHIAARPLPELSFPPNLKSLSLSGWRLPWERMALVGSLPNLEELILLDHAFEGSIWEPNEGEFNKLKFLFIETSSLEHWKASDTHFPNLQHLTLNLCPNLVEIPSEIGEIPTLEMLELYECSPSAVASAKLIEEEQRSLENNTLRVVCPKGLRTL